MFARPFVAHSQSAEVAETGQRTLHHVTENSQAAAVSVVVAGRQETDDAQRDHECDHLGGAVGAVAKDAVGFATRPTARTLNCRHRVQQGRQLLLIRHVGRRGLHHERNAIGVGQHVTFAPSFGSIHGIGAGVRPPFIARTDWLSITTCSRSTPPALPRRLSRRWCSCGQTPSRVQSRRRRQQLEPLTPKTSAGSICQGTPVLLTKRMPRKAARLSTGGRPPLGEGGGGGGRSGSISLHSSSESSSTAMTTPPCVGNDRRNHTRLHGFETVS